MCIDHWAMHVCCVGTRDAEVNIAEGKKRAHILASEAQRQEQINRAEGEANALLAVANAQANSVKVIAIALSNKASLLPVPPPAPLLSSSVLSQSLRIPVRSSHAHASSPRAAPRF